ncbi:hypothetical protein [Nocardia pseudovaccinii]|uniref:hypothetical protein n=1 Tax=Nocardia pseudovaccinii TaxID=189540 RepID=UPI000AE38776|nr:hypothetical protein [Nocardia pseudovaccinii]
MFGYINLDLVGTSRAAMEARLEEFANSYGGTVEGRIFCEQGSAVRVLWSLIREADSDFGGGVIPRVYAAARHRTVSMDRLLGSPSPTPALWRLLDALAHSDGGYLLVPSAAHFEHLGVPRHVFLQRISNLTPTVQVLFLDSGPWSSEPGLVAEFEVPAFPAEEFIWMNLRQRLARAGLGELVEPIGRLLHEVVGAALNDTAADPSLVHNTFRVRVLCPPESSTVVVEILDMRESSDEPVTRHELLLPGAEQASIDDSLDLADQWATDRSGWTPPEWFPVATGGR